MLVVKKPPANPGNVRDSGSVPGLGGSPGGGHGNPLQYSCLENTMDRGAWWAIVHGVAKSWTWLKQFSTHARTVYMLSLLTFPLGFPHSSVDNESAGSTRDLGSIPGLGGSSGEANDNPLQCSCLENSHGQRHLADYTPWGRKSWAWLSD